MSTGLGKVLFLNVYYTIADGSQFMLPIDVVATGIKGVRTIDFLDSNNTPVAFSIVAPELDSVKLLGVQLSLVYPDGSLELTPKFEFSSEIGFISWSRDFLVLATPTPDGDAFVDPPFVIGRRYQPLPNPKP
jgi:hypothetical protein